MGEPQWGWLGRLERGPCCPRAAQAGGRLRTKIQAPVLSLGVCWDSAPWVALKAMDNGKAGVLEFCYNISAVAALPELPELWPFLQMRALAASPLLFSAPDGVCGCHVPRPSRDRS